MSAAQACRCSKAEFMSSPVGVLGRARLTTPDPGHDVFGLIRLLQLVTIGQTRPIVLASAPRLGL